MTPGGVDTCCSGKGIRVSGLGGFQCKAAAAELSDEVTRLDMAAENKEETKLACMPDGHMTPGGVDTCCSGKGVRVSGLGGFQCKAAAAELSDEVTTLDMAAENKEE